MRYCFYGLYENKPLRLKTLIEHYFTIKGLSWQCTKIDHIYLFKTDQFMTGEGILMLMTILNKSKKLKFPLPAFLLLNKLLKGLSDGD